MCCDTCPRYQECEEKNRLKDKCCRQCPDYDYCQEEELYNGNNMDSENY